MPVLRRIYHSRPGGSISTIVCLAGLLFFTALAPASAQTPPDSVAALWSVFVDGRPGEFEPRPLPPDSAAVVAAGVLASLQQEGYLLARVDSAVVSGDERPPTVRLFVRRGPEIPVGLVRIEGASPVPAEELLRLMDTRPGRRLDAAVLEADVEAMLRRLESAGAPLAEIHVSALDLLPGDPPRLELVLEVRPGDALSIARLELPGAERTRPAFAARTLGLALGSPLRSYEPEEIRSRLAATELFEEVGEPELVLEEGGDAVLRIPVREAAPGAFDLVLGYLPGQGDERGTVVGNGHLALENLFGGGRRLMVRLNRPSARVSSLSASLRDPYLFATPFQGAVAFEGVQQDSTFNKQQYRAELGYRLPSGLEAFGTFAREVTRPGPFGLRLSSGRQRVPQAEAWFAGLGLRYRRLDRPVNQRRGIWVETNLERGRKERTTRYVAEDDTTRRTTAFGQRRLHLTSRLYVPAWRRQVVVAGLDAGLLLSDDYDRSDLFRFGGAASLRGYDEERFLGRFVGRALAEYRYQLDRVSYAFVFFDLGYVETPELPDLEGGRAFHPGYGLGVTFQTPLGILGVSYAANPDDGLSEGRIHAGLSFGL